jgi:hypothetical protein
MKNHKILAAVCVGLAVSLSAAQAQTIIYQDTFTRTGALNGSSPDIASGLDGGTNGATWTAAADWTTNGSVASTTTLSSSLGSTTYLPFTPVVGVT